MYKQKKCTKLKRQWEINQSRKHWDIDNSSSTYVHSRNSTLEKAVCW